MSIAKSALSRIQIFIGCILMLMTVSQPMVSDAAGQNADIRGIITTINYDTLFLTVNGIPVQATPSTQIFNVADQPIGFSDLEFGQNIRARIALFPGGPKAFRIDVLDAGSGTGDPQQFRGVIQSINADLHTLVVSGVLVITTQQTVYQDLDRNTISFSDLAQGQFVKVQGTGFNEGSFLAGKIELENDLGGGGDGDLPPFNFRFQGRIMSIDPETRTLVVSDRLVHTNEFTRFENMLGQTIAFEDLALGHFVDVKGNRQDDDSVLALKIQQKLRLPGEDRQVEFKGIVRQINLTSHTLLVGQQHVITTGTTRIVDSFGEPTTFDAIAVGQLLEIKGFRLPGGQVLALLIRIEDRFGHENLRARIRLRGHIQQIDPTTNSLTVLGFRIDTNTSTTLFGPNNVPIAFADLNLNDFIDVKAFRKPNGHLLGLRIRRRDSAPSNPQAINFIVRGAISSIQAIPPSIQIQGLDVQFNSETRIEGPFGHPVPLDQLHTGLYVRVFARVEVPVVILVVPPPPLSAPIIMARLVQISDQQFEFNDPVNVDLIGLITAIDLTSRTMVVRHRTVITIPETLFADETGAPIGFADFDVGQIVRVRGHRLENGNVVALRVNRKRPGSGGGDALRFRGLIESINPTSHTLHVNGILVQATPFTIYRNAMGHPIGFVDLEVGQFIKVQGIALADNRVLAGKISQLDNDDDGDDNNDDDDGADLRFDTRFKGVIEQIDPTDLSFIINGRLVRTDHNTRFEDGADQRIEFADFEVGQVVRVLALSLDDDSFRAVKVQIDEEDNEDRFEIEFKGLIRAINPGDKTLRVGPHLVHTDLDTVFLDVLGSPIPFEDLAVGQLVEVKAIVQPPDAAPGTNANVGVGGRLLAREIKLEDRDGRDEHRGVFVHLRAPIESIDPTLERIVVLGLDIGTTTRTMIFDHPHTDIPFSALNVGDFVQVAAHRTTGTALLAIKIKRLDIAGGVPEVRIQIRGPILNIDIAAGTINVGGFIIEVDSTTRLENAFGVPVRIEDLAIGRYIVVSGTPPSAPTGPSPMVVTNPASAKAQLISEDNQLYLFATPPPPEAAAGDTWTMYW